MACVRRAFSTSVVRPKALLPSGWQAVIGIECHAQLSVPQKLFSPTVPSAHAAPNTRVAPFDAGLPGTLPRLQDAAVQAALKAALALQCTIVSHSVFDRKHYFYADQPMGFQITQKRIPYAHTGSVAVRFEDGYLASESDALQVPIEQVQLEQDTAKSMYAARDDARRVQLLDFNRAGAALIEIVSAPAMHTPEQAGAYVRKVRDLLRCVQASDGNMNEGSLRCDVNVSVHKQNTPLGVRCEIKNLNSVKFLMQALAYEMRRQYTELAAGRTIEQESRGFDEAHGVTYTLRSKEDAPDYRYLHEPNVPPLVVTPERIAALRAALPELPDARHARLRARYRLSVRDINVLTRVNAEDDTVAAPPHASAADPSTGWTYEPNAVRFFEQLTEHGIAPQTAMNWTIHHLLKELNAAHIPFCRAPVPPAALAELIGLVEEQLITSKTAHALLREMLHTQRVLTEEGASSLRAVVARRGWTQLRTDAELRPVCDAVVRTHAQDADAVRAGKTKALQKLVGAVMRATHGRADAVAAHALLAARLAST